MDCKAAAVSLETEPEAPAFGTGDRRGLAPFKENWKPNILWVGILWSPKTGSSYEG